MRSGSGNVMCITFDGLTFRDQFCQPFEAFAATGNPRQGGLQQPIVFKALHQSGAQSQPDGIPPLDRRGGQKRRDFNRCGVP
jgi:hypothetical protein